MAWFAEPISTATRAALYALAAESDSSRLDTLVAAAASTPPTPARDSALDALLQRDAELDPARAVTLGLDARAPTSTMIALFGQWAKRDPQAALDRLAAIDDRPLMREIAVDLLETLGGSDATLAEIRDALPQTERQGFQTAALGAEAGAAPAAALERALGLPDATGRDAAALRVAEVWARQNPHEALAQLELVDDTVLRKLLVSKALVALATVDPETVADYLSSADPETVALAMQDGAAEQFRLLDPKRAVDVGRRLPQPLGSYVTAIALGRLATSDLPSAMAYADTLPAGERPQAQQAIARNYAGNQPDAALAWARDLRPPRPDLVRNVILGIADNDPVRALDLALETQSPTLLGMPNSALMVVLSKLQDDEQAQTMASRLLTLQDAAQRQRSLSWLLGAWSARNPEGALDWITTNDTSVDPQSFRNVAARMGQRDAAAAAAATDRVPAAARAYWIQGVAGSYAALDLDAALAWLDRYRGQAGYANGLATIASTVARYDAPRAAQLLSRADATGPLMSAALHAIANQWAQQSPAPAADWALSLADASTRSQMVSQVARVWASTDAAGARGWVLSLPAGDGRDMALRGVLATLAARIEPDAALIGAFSSDRARQEGVMDTIFVTARRDPDRARMLVDRYVTDPALRQRAEKAMENATKSMRSSAFIANGPGFQIQTIN